MNNLYISNNSLLNNVNISSNLTGNNKNIFINCTINSNLYVSTTSYFNYLSCNTILCNQNATSASIISNNINISNQSKMKDIILYSNNFISGVTNIYKNTTIVNLLKSDQINTFTKLYNDSIILISCPSILNGSVTINSLICNNILNNLKIKAYNH